MTVHSMTLWDENIDQIKKEFEIWKEREPESIETLSFSETVTIPEDSDCDAGRSMCVGIYKGDTQLFRRVMIICGVRVN